MRRGRADTLCLAINTGRTARMEAETTSHVASKQSPPNRLKSN